MSYVAITFILLLSVSPVFLSCTKTEINNSSSVSPGAVIPNVPFVKQKYRFCGPAALTSVLRYYGRDTDQDKIAENVYTPELKGSLISDMKHYAEENGFLSETKNGDLKAIITLINENKPVILLVDKGKLGIPIQHYYVVYGYKPENNLFIIHDGKKNGNEISYSKLDKEWEKMNRLMLVINYED
jgi:ABC-type bacteriocin/lantibiotic exporter with double-glycine peptidase domain